MEDVTLEELRGLLDGGSVLLLDVRTPGEYEGVTGSHCDPRQGHIPGAVNVSLERILECRSVDEARALADGALDGRLEVFPGAGHFVAVDQPERFNEVLLEFLGQWRT